MHKGLPRRSWACPAALRGVIKEWRRPFVDYMFGAPASGTPERSARREFELLLLLGGNRKGAVQLWKWERRQRIYATPSRRRER